MIDIKKSRKVLQVVPISGHDSCQRAQCWQELFGAIKACPNLRRVLGIFGNPLLTAQLVILALSPRTGVCFPSKTIIPLGAFAREVLLVRHSPRAEAGFSSSCSQRSNLSVKRIFKGFSEAWLSSKKKGVARPSLFWEASLALV